MSDQQKIIQDAIKSIEQVACDLTNVRADLNGKGYCITRVLADLGNQLCKDADNLEKLNRWMEHNQPSSKGTE